MSPAYLKVTFTAYSPVSFCKCCDFGEAFFCWLCLQRFWFLDTLCQGEKGISGLAPAPPASCWTALSSTRRGLAGTEHAGGREEAVRGSQAAQRRGSPYSHLNPSLLRGALLAGAGEMRRAGEGSRGNGWSCLASLAGLPSPSPTLYVSLEKLLRGGRHSNTEGPATGAASVGGSSTFCMSQQGKGGRSYPLCNVCIFQDVSEVHASKVWHIRAQKLE